MVLWAVTQRLIPPAAQKAGRDNCIRPKYRYFRGPVSGRKSHSQEVAAFMSVPGLLTLKTTLAVRLSLSLGLVSFRFGHPVLLSKDG